MVNGVDTFSLNKVRKHSQKVEVESNLKHSVDYIRIDLGGLEQWNNWYGHVRLSVRVPKKY